jgi:Lrp/AsnC family leucine-responsive transcriptional regulator
MLCYLIKQSRKRICRFLSPKTNPTHQGICNQFESEVVQLKVLECYHVSGDYDYILKIVVKTWKPIESFSHKINNTSAYW